MTAEKKTAEERVREHPYLSIYSGSDGLDFITNCLVDQVTSLMDDHAAAAVEEVARERDEAREELGELATTTMREMETRTREFARVIRERDEARAALEDIRGRLGGHRDSQLDGDNGLAAATMREVERLRAAQEGSDG